MTLWANLALAVGSAGVLAGIGWQAWPDLEGRERTVLVAGGVAGLPVATLGAILFTRDLLALTGPAVEVQALATIGLALGLMALLAVGAHYHRWERHPWVLAVPFAVLLAIVFLPVWLSTHGVGAVLGATLMAVAAFGARGLPPVVGRAATGLPARAGTAGALGAHAVTAGAAIVALLFALNYSGAVEGTEIGWSTRVAPTDGDAVDVQVPFLDVGTATSAHPAAAPTLSLLRDRVHIADGDASLERVEGGRAVHVRGSSPVTVRADLTYFSGGQGSEAFLDWTIPTRNVTNLGGENVTVTWRLSASGGFCGISGEARAEVPAEGSAPLASIDPDEEAILRAVCA